MLQTEHIFSDIINEKTRATGLENFFLTCLQSLLADGF
jgi:hypothetical protein